LRDAIRGCAAALTAALAVVVYAAGTGAMPSREVAVGVAVALGLLASSCWSASFMGRLPSFGAACADGLVSGLFAAAAGAAPLWKAPACRTDLVHLSAFGAALFSVLYHSANAVSLDARRRHLGPLGVCVAVCLPFATGLVLALQPGALADRVGKGGACRPP
jgi:hypothetical protein